MHGSYITLYIVDINITLYTHFDFLVAVGELKKFDSPSKFNLMSGNRVLKSVRDVGTEQSLLT